VKREGIDKKIIKDLKGGDIVAFDAVYEKYFHRLYGFVLRYLKRSEDAEGIVQDVFLKIWESRNKIDVYSSFESFIFTITYNATISLLRKRLSEDKYLEQLKYTQQSEKIADLNEDIDLNELDQKVQVLLNKLTPRQKDVFILSRIEGLTHKEIANKLNLSVNTVKNHMVSALSFLKANIDSNYFAFFLYISLFL